jgi:hypothetical protein
MTQEHKADIENIEIDLVNSVASDHLSEIAVEAYEAVFDMVLEEGFIQNIPIFGSLYKGGKALLSIKDQYFVKKVFRFLCEIKDVAVEKRLEFIRELEEESDVAQSAGETLVMLIDRLDNLEKPIILGRLLKAKAEGYIDLLKFLRLSSIVEKAFMPDLKRLGKYVSTNYEPEDEAAKSLESLGLLGLPLDLIRFTFRFKRCKSDRRL